MHDIINDVKCEILRLSDRLPRKWSLLVLLGGTCSLRVEGRRQMTARVLAFRSGAHTHTHTHTEREREREREREIHRYNRAYIYYV